MTEQHNKDPTYRRAKREGYRARSAYKLLEIEKRYKIFKRVFYIFDIGSAPGSWLQVAKSKAEENLLKYNDKYYHRDSYKILGVDVKKITPIENVKILKMDISEPEFLPEVKSYFGDEVDLIISDASIQKSGNKFSDQVHQIRLCYKILEFSEILKKNGNMVIKLFRGADYQDFFDVVKRKFQFVKGFKPKSSYKKSNETFIIGLKKF
jgi:23S rRNA (uridine2552-2'-O)-methyltransferase